MAEYLLLFRGGDAARAETQQSPEKWEAHMQKWMQWMGSLSEQGKFVGAQPLKSAGKVVSGTGRMVTDGPFVEGKEMVGGYLICKADSFEEAVEISKGCPVLEHDGRVEVREIGDIRM
ncbi:YciI family protein [Chitinophagaceae bacterium MMS25-I14]